MTNTPAPAPVPLEDAARLIAASVVAQLAAVEVRRQVAAHRSRRMRAAQAARFRHRFAVNPAAALEQVGRSRTLAV